MRVTVEMTGLNIPGRSVIAVYLEVHNDKGPDSDKSARFFNWLDASVAFCDPIPGTVPGVVSGTYYEAALQGIAVAVSASACEAACQPLSSSA